MNAGQMSRVRSRILIIAGLTALVAGTWWLLAEHTRGAEIATDIAVPIALLGLLAAVFGVSLRPRAVDYPTLVAAARALAREVAQRESVEQLKLLAEVGRGRPADLGFAQAAVAVSWRTDGGRQRGSLAQIAGFYGELELGRLVVLGQPGSGKTVLIDQLLLDLIERLPEADPVAGTRLVVPVRLSLPAFDPGRRGGREDGESVSGLLDEWLRRHLVDVYGLSLPAASGLVQEGWILPILDGLDEMDPDGRTPVKASAVMRALNHPVGTGRSLRSVVVASRSDRYRELAAPPARPGRLQVLQDATAVTLEPLSIDQVIAYLTHRFHHFNEPGRIQERWQPVVDCLRSRRRRALATALQSPLRLFVAVTAYYTGDPSELLKVSAARLDEHLFSRLIPAVVEQHPGPAGVIYDAEDVTHWLTGIAAHLRHRAEQGASESDLDLHLLWSAAGPRAPRYLAATAMGTLVLATFVPPYLWYVHTLRSWLPDNDYGWVLVSVAFALLVLTVRRAITIPVNLQRLDLQSMRTTVGRRRVAKWVLRFLTVGLLFGAVFGIAYGLSFGLAFGIGCGSAFGISFGLEQRPSIISRPSVLVSQGITHDVAVVVAFACSFGLANGFANDLIKGLVGGITFGMAYGLSAGVVFIANSPWPRYLAATRLLAREHRLPVRPAIFLDWAYTAGLLRQSGVSAQFRHRELQARLIASVQPAVGTSQARAGRGRPQGS